MCITDINVIFVKVKEIAEQTQKGFDELIQMLDEEKYHKART
jgi:hypothetical protein